MSLPSQATEIQKLISKVAAGFADQELRSVFWYLFLLALATSVINALKPMQIDDTFYFWIAQHIVSEPLDPFGLEILWFQWPGIVSNGYIPPLLPYWLALSISVLGENPFLLKLSMLPFIFLFVLATFALGKRFSPALAMPLTFFITLSPAILPSWNIMLDLPSIALGLCAIELFIRAIENDSWKYALAAGCLAALAALTKYTALVVPGVMLLYSVLNRRLLFGLLSGVCTLAIIIAWECLYFLLYGHAQLLWAVKQGGHDYGFGIGFFAVAALATLGALLPVLTTAYLPFRTINSSFLVVAGGWLLLVLGGYLFGIYAGHLSALFITLGLVLCAAVIAGVSFAIFTGHPQPAQRDDSIRIYLFLFGWLLLEAAGMLLMSPFPAVRRLLVISIILSFLGFRVLATKIPIEAKRLGLIACWILVLANLALTSMYAVVDYKDATAQRTLARQAVDMIRQADRNGAIWYIGHWGFAYHAEAEGMKPVIPDWSVLRENDWLVIPDRVHQQEITLDWDLLAQRATVGVKDDIPLHTVASFYAGQRPLEVKEGRTRLSVAILQVKEEHRAKSSWMLDRIIHHVQKRPNLVSTAYALPALLEFKTVPHAKIRRHIVENVGLMKKHAADFAPAIAEMAVDEDASVRIAVLKTLPKLGNRDPKILAVIKARTEDPVAEVRQAAINALKELNGFENK